MTARDLLGIATESGVTHLRDDSGQLWERDEIGQQWVTVTDDPAKFRVKAYSDWADFLDDYGLGPFAAADTRDDERAPALCASGCGSPVAWEGACCDPCDSDAADEADRARSWGRP